MKIIETINFFIGILFTVCYSYQLFYILVPLFARIFRKKKPSGQPEDRTRRYAVVIAARNESAVIAHLIESIKNQDYPAELVDTYVIADNCTDNTAEIAERAGAIVYERTNDIFKGKGYALSYFFERVPIEKYNGFFIFDADNVLSPNYITEMNKMFSDKNRVITSCRNSKNYGDNWISAGYALWFLRESKYLNRSRYILGTSSAVSGTGFLIHRDIMAAKGWNYHLLTEDIEFTIDSIIDGEKISYCDSAVFFDEQPTSFRQSCRQRLRWSKGYLQVFEKYGKNLVRKVFKGSFSCYDMTMNIAPAAIITFTALILNIIYTVIALISGAGVVAAFRPFVDLFLWGYGFLYFIGAITVATQWKKIYCSNFQKILYTFTFPIFMYTYLPISIAAFFVKVEWKAITHNVPKSVDTIINYK